MLIVFGLIRVHRLNPYKTLNCQNHTNYSLTCLVSDSTTPSPPQLVAAAKMKTTVKRVLHFFDSTSSQVDPKLLEYCEYDKNDDWYLQFIKLFYFPLLLKYNRHFCLLWLVVFVIAIIFGPEFLSLTRSDLEVPSDTPIASALKAFKANFPITPTYVTSIFFLPSYS